MTETARTDASTGPVTRKLGEIEDEYAGDDERPLRSYAATIATYGTVVAGLATLVQRRGGFPERIDTRDLVLAGVATHKLSRLLSKGTVTSPLRAPFTRFTGVSGPSELEEEARGHGVQHTVGELITCPFCTSQWVATGFTFGFALAPRATRFAAALLSTVALSDLLQFAYAKAGEVEEG